MAMASDVAQADRIVARTRIIAVPPETLFALAEHGGAVNAEAGTPAPPPCAVVAKAADRADAVPASDMAHDLAHDLAHEKGRR